MSTLLTAKDFIQQAERWEALAGKLREAAGVEQLRSVGIGRLDPQQDFKRRRARRGNRHEQLF